jgi:hypothetical protein
LISFASSLSKDFEAGHFKKSEIFSILTRIPTPGRAKYAFEGAL